MSAQHAPLPTHARASEQPAKTEGSSSSGKSDECSREECRKTQWAPNYERRQSWSAEEQKHQAHVESIHAVKTGPGFTEQA
ncbi:hypothetical protein K4F52_004910 [Lecanicillium sp. MT-2017a]|nr:hypothetical protein K4F52_004910 [Lecanicillium sp. MT-2017a]